MVWVVMPPLIKVHAPYLASQVMRYLQGGWSDMVTCIWSAWCGGRSLGSVCWIVLGVGCGLQWVRA